MTKNIIMVIARYNEKLEWLKEEPFNKYKAIVYNKGINNDFEKHNVIKIIRLKNVGRENHTYFHHIITNYTNLSDFTIFLPGSVNMMHKKTKAIKLISMIEKTNTSVFLVDTYCYDLKLIGGKHEMVNYSTTNKENHSINKSSHVTPAKIRPYYNWLEDKFPKRRIKYVSFHSIIGVSKKDILNNTKKYYLKFYNELKTSCNPEEGFFVEGSWSEVFNISNVNVITPGFNYYYHISIFMINTYYMLFLKYIIKFLLILCCMGFNDKTISLMDYKNINFHI